MSLAEAPRVEGAKAVPQARVELFALSLACGDAPDPLSAFNYRGSPPHLLARALAALDQESFAFQLGKARCQARMVADVVAPVGAASGIHEQTLPPAGAGLALKLEQMVDDLGKVGRGTERGLLGVEM